MSWWASKADRDIKNRKIAGATGQHSQRRTAGTRRSPKVAEPGTGYSWRAGISGLRWRLPIIHNANMDYPPCAFSRTHVIAPERSVGGLLRALRAGTFWADQGRILDELDVRLETENLRGAARPGDTIFAPRNEILRVSLNSSIANACRRCPLLHEHEIALMVGTATAHSRVF